jgi:hypothetical protein
MKRILIFTIFATFVVATSIQLFCVLKRDERYIENGKKTASVMPSYLSNLDDIPIPSALTEKEQTLALGTGEEHAEAFVQLMEWIKNQQVLTPEDRDALLTYLTQPQPPTLSSGEWEERVNEILNLLRTQQGGVPGLSELMLHMAEQDPNPVLRMYALQHIAMWIPDEPTPEKREAMVKYLQQLLQRPNDPLAGSALLFLTDLEHTGQIQRSAETDAQFQTAALNLITNPKTRPDVKISVLHACVDRKQNDILPTARTIAADESLMIPLRKAAIHCIARLGSKEDIPLFESLAAENKDLQAATTPALENLKK